MDPAPEKKTRKLLLFGVIGVLATLGLAALAGLGVLFVVGVPMISAAVESAERAKCMQSLRHTYQDLVKYQVEHHALPQSSGARFLIAPYVEGDSPVAGEHVDEPDPAYFGRDMERFPLEAFPGDGTEPLAACGRKVPEHHPDVVHVLYAHGSIQELSLADLKARGAVPPDTQALLVGPDSAVPDLRKLRRD